MKIVQKGQNLKHKLNFGNFIQHGRIKIDDGPHPRNVFDVLVRTEIKLQRTFAGKIIQTNQPFPFVKQRQHGNAQTGMNHALPANCAKSC